MHAQPHLALLLPSRLLEHSIPVDCRPITTAQPSCTALSVISAQCGTLLACGGAGGSCSHQGVGRMRQGQCRHQQQHRQLAINNRRTMSICFQKRWLALQNTPAVGGKRQVARVSRAATATGKLASPPPRIAATMLKPHATTGCLLTLQLLKAWVALHNLPQQRPQHGGPVVHHPARRCKGHVKPSSVAANRQT